MCPVGGAESGEREREKGREGGERERGREVSSKGRRRNLQNRETDGESEHIFDSQ